MNTLLCSNYLQEISGVLIKMYYLYAIINTSKI